MRKLHASMRPVNVDKDMDGFVGGLTPAEADARVCPTKTRATKTRAFSVDHSTRIGKLIFIYFDKFNFNCPTLIRMLLKQQHLTWAVVCWLAECGIPPSVVENPAFKEMTRAQPRGGYVQRWNQAPVSLQESLHLSRTRSESRQRF